MGFFDDIGKEFEKALNPNSSNIPQYISKIKPLKKEFDETIYYLNQLEKKREENELDKETYDSLLLEYQQRKLSLLEKLDKYYEKYSNDKTESESIVKRASFEKGEIISQLSKNTNDFTNDLINEVEYKSKKKDLELKSKKSDIQLEKAKKTLKALEGINGIFAEYEANKK